MEIKAHAKINLGLNVKRRLDNGYHELEMIMVPINFYDRLTIEIADEMSFTSNKDYVKLNPDNTINVAVNYLRNKYHFKENFKIDLKKSIPTRAGMAGGSSDAAAVIKGINRLLNLQMSDEELKEAALSVGADVYFCLVGKCAKVLGIGDIVEPFKCRLDFEIILVKPKKGVSTKKSFARLNLDLCDHPDIELIKEALENNDYDKLIKTIGNSLEEPSFKVVKEIKTIKQRLLDEGFDAALMSGSGSTVFGITRNRDLVDKTVELMRNEGYFTRKAKIAK